MSQKCFPPGMPDPNPVGWITLKWMIRKVAELIIGKKRKDDDDD